MNYHEDAELGAHIKSQANYYEAPQGLRDRIVLALAGVEPPKAQHWTKRWLEWQRWMGMGVAFACGVLLSVAVSYFHDDKAVLPNRIVAQVIGGHVRSLMLTHLSDVASSDQHTVKPWFNGKLDYSPPVTDLASDGFPLIGGRLDYMDERPVAALVYRHKLHTLNVFVWPVRSKYLPVYGTVTWHGYNVTSWQEGGMQFWAVSDINTSELQKFAGLLRDHPST